MIGVEAIELRPLDTHDDAAIEAWHATYHAADIAGREWAVPYQLEEVRADFQTKERARWVQAWSGFVGGEVVVAGAIETPQHDNLDSAWLQVHTHLGHRRRAYGSAMLQRLDDVATSRARTVLNAEGAWPQEADSCASDPVRKFLENRGYVLGLLSVNRNLDLPVPLEYLASLRKDAAGQHSAYTLQSWIGPVPGELAEGLAALISTLSTESPMGDLHVEPDTSDVADLRAGERTLAAQGRTKYNTVALDAVGSIVGYTDLVTSVHEGARAFQWGTLVRRADRGHRLGLALKVVNLRLLQTERPDITSILTNNAEVNRHMIGINETLGFRAVEHLGEFQKRVSSSATLSQLGSSRA